MKKILSQTIYLSLSIAFALVVLVTPKPASAVWVDYHHTIPYTVVGPTLTVSLTANPYSMTLPTNSTRLTWATSVNPLPDSCSAFSSWTGLKTPLPNGHEDMTGLTPGTYVYSILCSKVGFPDAVDSAIVTVNDSGSTVTASLIANPISLPFGGGTSNLTWSSTNATNGCVGTGFNTGGAPSGGPQQVSLSTTTTYYLTCSGASGSAQAQATVTVAPSSVLNGRCAATHYFCTAGVSANQVENPTNYTWNCVGSHGGTTASCSESKGPCIGKGCGGGGGDTQCSNSPTDDDGDGLVDTDDPSCHTDCDATKPLTYNAALDDEGRICTKPIRPKYIEI